VAAEKMRAGRTEKTNAMRVLDAHGVEYEVVPFPEHLRGAVEVSEFLQVSPDCVYKTLVVRRPGGKPILIMVPGGAQLDLKRVARAVNVKRVAMASHRDAERITGLKVGGISALALRGPRFDVLIHRDALRHDHVYVSAGRRGLNLRLAVADLVAVTAASVADLVRGTT
jgi:Cys-tRNA(Pro)/Cys-tRNA(Cys) deacylase